MTVHSRISSSSSSRNESLKNGTGNATNTTTVSRRPRSAALFANTSTFEFRIVPNASINLTLTSDCSSLQLSSTNFNLSNGSSMVATLKCSVLDQQTVEEGLTVVSRAIVLDIPDKQAIVYPFEMALTLDLAPTYFRNRRRFLLQQPDESRIVYKVFYYNNITLEWSMLDLSAYDPLSKQAFATIPKEIASEPGFVWVFVAMEDKRPAVTPTPAPPPPPSPPPPPPPPSTTPETPNDSTGVIAGSVVGTAVLIGIVVAILMVRMRSAVKPPPEKSSQTVQLKMPVLVVERHENTQIGGHSGSVSRYQGEQRRRQPASSSSTIMSMDQLFASAGNQLAVPSSSSAHRTAYGLRGDTSSGTWNKNR